MSHEPQQYIVVEGRVNVQGHEVFARKVSVIDESGGRLVEATYFLKAGMSFQPLTIDTFHITFFVEKGSGLACLGSRRIRPYRAKARGFVFAGQLFGVLKVQRDTEIRLLFHPAIASLGFLYRAHRLARQAVENPLTIRLLGPGPAET